MIRRVIPRFLPETRGKDILQALMQGYEPEQEQELMGLLAEVTATRVVQLMPSARAGLYWLLRALSPPRLYLPAFLCSSVYECALRAGTPLTYLDCKHGSFETELDGIDYESGSVLLLVHQYGIPADPVKAAIIAKKYGLILVEDVAPSLGSTWSDRPTGSFGDAAIISFEYSKTISACKGGAIVYTDIALAERVQECIVKAGGPLSLPDPESIFRRDAINGLFYELSLMPLVYGTFVLPIFRALHGGFVNRSETVELRGTYPANFGARRAWLAAKMLRQMPEIKAGRHRVVQIYREILVAEDNITLAPIPVQAQPVYTHYPLLVPQGSRDVVVSALWAKGIDPGFNFSYLCGGEVAAAAAPVAGSYTRRVLTLPVSSRINNLLARRIAETFRDLVRQLCRK